MTVGTPDKKNIKMVNATVEFMKLSEQDEAMQKALKELVEKGGNINRSHVFIKLFKFTKDDGHVLIKFGPYFH
jgi:hypothetical protein